MEFWSQLSEEYPDLGKLNEIGIKISQSISSVTIIGLILKTFKKIFFYYIL